MRKCECCGNYYIERRGLVLCSEPEIMFHYDECPRYDEVSRKWPP
jgi:hypothetical protein